MNPGVLYAMQFRKHKLHAALLIAVTLSGCTLGPDYVRPELALPDSYRKPVIENTDPSQSSQTIAPFKKDWWTLFNDSELDVLMQTALADNADVKIAIARLAQAEPIAKQELIAGEVSGAVTVVEDERLGVDARDKAQPYNGKDPKKAYKRKKITLLKNPHHPRPRIWIVVTEHS